MFTLMRSAMKGGNKNSDYVVIWQLNDEMRQVME